MSEESKKNKEGTSEGTSPALEIIEDVQGPISPTSLAGIVEMTEGEMSAKEKDLDGKCLRCKSKSTGTEEDTVRNNIFVQLHQDMSEGAKKKKGPKAPVMEIIEDLQGPISPDSVAGNISAKEKKLKGDKVYTKNDGSDGDVQELGPGQTSQQPINQGGQSESRYGNASPPANFFERVKSMYKVPEAWTVNEDPEPGAEVLFAKPILPWWEQDESRLNAWAGLCLFSILTLVSLMMAPEPDSSVESWETTLTACMALSIFLSLMGSLGHMSNTKINRYFVGNKLEGILSLSMVGLWAFIMKTVLNPTNELARVYLDSSEMAMLYSSTGTTVSVYHMALLNPNLYFFSWAALICALIVSVMFVWECFSKSGGLGMWYFSKWFLILFITSIVVHECNSFRYQECDYWIDVWGYSMASCTKNLIALASGCVGLAISFFMAIASFRGKDSVRATAVASFAMAVIYTVCAGLLCFEMDLTGYGNNLWFFTWAGFFMSYYLFGRALKEWFRIRNEREASEDAEETPQAEDEVNEQPAASMLAGGIGLSRLSL